jgi:nitrogen regulatory protein P-II 2
MKMVVAIIQPQQLPDVKRALFDAQVKHLTCTNVLGTATEGAQHQTFRGVTHDVTLLQKIRIELTLRDEMVEQAVEANEKGARESGGFGMVFVSDLLNVVNVFTGERGEEAIK